MKHSGIYQITNKLNGHFYIGSSVDIKQRWNRHLHDLRNGTHSNLHLQAAFNKYGHDCFIFSVIEYCDNESLLIQEQKYIDRLYPEYNLYPIAGSPLGMKHSNETKMKMSISHTGKPSGMLGKSQSDECRKKVGDANRGKPKPPRSEEHCRKISEHRIAYWKHKKEGNNLCVP